VRSAGVLFALCALGACGRIGFTDAPLDAAKSDDDASDAGTPDAAPDAIDITVFNREMNTATPVAGSMVVVDDGVTTQLLEPDAGGHVHVMVSGNVTVHVAVPNASSRWTITTYEDIPPGTSILVGPSADFENGTSRIWPVPVVAGTNFYATSVPAECGGGGGSSGNMAVFRSFVACDNSSIPIVVRASDSANNLLGILHATVVPATTTTIPGPFQAPTTTEIAFPSNPLLTFFTAMTYHRDGAHWVNTSGNVAGQSSNVATLLTSDQTIDRVELYWGTGTHTHELATPVDPAVGIRSTVGSERDALTLATITRGPNHTLNWTYALTSSVHLGSTLVMHEKYGNVTHVYVVDPSRSSITRPRLPAPLDTLYDGADVVGMYGYLFQLDEQTFAQSLYNAEYLATGYDPPNDYFVRENLLINQ
jgi:hypothetical protein